MKKKLMITPSSGRVWVAGYTWITLPNGYWARRWQAIAGFDSEALAISAHPTAKWRDSNKWGNWFNG